MTSQNFHSLKKIIIFLGLLIFSFSYTEKAHGKESSSKIYDSILKEYAKHSSKWVSTFKRAANRLFWSLVLISIVWTFGQQILKKDDIGEIFSEFVRFTIFTGFFWWLLNNGDFISKAILESLFSLARDATGFKKITPSSIFDIGLNLLSKASEDLSISNLTSKIIPILISIIIFSILCVISANFLLLMCSAWILSYAGIFFLGFGGSKWTSSIAMNYYKSVLSLGTELMTTVLLVGIGSDFLKNITSVFLEKEGFAIDDFFILLGFSIIFYFLCIKIPPPISGIINGSFLGSNSSMVERGVSAAVSSINPAITSTRTAAKMISAKTETLKKGFSGENFSSKSGSPDKIVHNLGIFGKKNSNENFK